MPRRPNVEIRIEELENALLHLLEVQVQPSTTHTEEWDAAVKDARRAYRNKLEKGWRKMDILERYNLESSFEDEMVRGNDRDPVVFDD